MESEKKVSLPDNTPATKRLIQRAETLGRQARQVTTTLGLVKRWSTLGKVVEVGSSQFGLMTSPNLDMEIYVSHPDISQGFAIIQEIANQAGVESIVYHNFLETADPGLYWRIDYRDHEGLLWDIDQWLVPHNHPHAGMAERFATTMRETLTESSRRTILTLKDARDRLPAVRGIDIYRAVLSDKVETIEEFSEWLINDPPNPEEIVTWSP